MKKYLIFTIREFLGLDNDYETLLENQEAILNKLKDIDTISLENKTLLLEEQQTSYYDYVTLKNLLLLLIFLSFIGGGFWLYNTAYFDLNNINSLATELNTNTKALAEVIKDTQHINYQNIGVLLEKLNTNVATLSEKELQMLNEILLHARTIRAVVKPIAAGSQQVFEGVKIEDITWGSYSDDE
jgi:hypothetical protein